MLITTIDGRSDQRCFSITEIIMGGVKYHPTHKWYPGGTPLYGLYRDVPLVMGWFLTSLSKTGYTFSCESVWRVLPAWLIWFAEWILFVLQVNKSNDCNVNFFYSGVTPLYKSYRYVPPRRVGFLRRFGLKTGIHFAHFSLESGMIFEGTTGMYEKLIVSIPNE